MKKVININFKGRVIPIEEVAFEQLQNYIESLRRYFSNEEGRDEIINDIEDRIAELFEEELKKGAACITEEKVNAVLNSMGRVEDFEQLDSEPGVTGASSGTSNQTYEAPRGEFSRNANDQVLGGVCSGIAHYLKIDPTIVRVLFVLFTISYGAGLLIYIILWAVLPARQLASNVKKRLFRDPDQKVLGGVASGLANYFNIAVWIPRVVFISPLILGALSSLFSSMFWWDFDVKPIFITSGFGGTLFLTYLVLWIVLPKATSAAEKLQMRGEKIDVGSISKAVKEDLRKMGDDVKSGAQRVSSEMQGGAQRMGEEVKERAQAFANEAGPVASSAASRLGNAIGILFKAFFLMIAGLIAFSLLMALFGVSVAGVVAWPLKDFFFEGNSQNFAVWGTLLFFLFVPVIGMFVWIIRRIFGIKSRNSYLGYVFGGLWVIGWFCVSLLGYSIAKNFRNRSEIAEPVAITQPAKNKMLVTVTEPAITYSDSYWWIHDDNDETGWDISEDSLKLSTIGVQVEQSTDSAYSVQLFRRSYGQSKTNAAEKAGKIYYKVNYQDSVLDLGSFMAISKADKFRGQYVRVVIKVPVGKQIRFDRSVENKLNPVNYNINTNGRDWDDEWDNDADFNYAADTDYIMTTSGLRRVDGKDNNTDNYRQNKREETAPAEQEERREPRQNDSNRYRYQPRRVADSTRAKAIATLNAPMYQPITVSAL